MARDGSVGKGGTGTRMSGQGNRIGQRRHSGRVYRSDDTVRCRGPDLDGASLKAGWPVGTVTSLYGTGGVGNAPGAVASELRRHGPRFSASRRRNARCCQSSAKIRRRTAPPAGLHQCQHGYRHAGSRCRPLQSRFGKTNVMATIEGGLLKATDFYRDLLAAAKQSGARLEHHRQHRAGVRRE